MPAIHVMSDYFDAELETELPVIVDFYATWCGPCKVLSPILDSLADKHEGMVKVLKIDIGQCPEIAAKFKVVSIPYIGIFKNGELVDHYVGFSGKEHIEKIFESLVT